MISFLIRLTINAATLIALGNFSSGAIQVKSWTSAFVAALILGFFNALIKPIAMAILSILTLPLSCLTLGLWTLVLSWILNAVLFQVTASFTIGFEVAGFRAALGGSLVLAIVNSVASAMLAEDKPKRRN